MLGILFSVVGFLLALSFLVIIHELGHYVTAKWFKVRVDEFGLGYPPKIATLFRKWNTDFTLNSVPIGGFVRLAGEERASDDETTDSQEMFYNKPAWQRVIVLAAGAAMNFLFGIIAFSILYTVQGIPELRPLDHGILVTNLSPDSPALEAGILPGDIITDVGLNESAQMIESVEQFGSLVKENGGQTIKITLERGTKSPREVVDLSVYVRTAEEIPENDGAIGVAIADVENVIEYVTYPWYQMPIRGSITGLQASFNFGYQIVVGISTMFAGLFQAQVPADVAGPVGIAYISYRENIFLDFEKLFNFLAILSINLAVVNLLPIPALDGGRIFFLLLEKIFNRKFKPHYEQYANAVGFFVLISLIVLVTFKDVGTIFGDIGFSLTAILGK